MARERGRRSPLMNSVQENQYVDAQMWDDDEEMIQSPSAMGRTPQGTTFEPRSAKENEVRNHPDGRNGQGGWQRNETPIYAAPQQHENPPATTQMGAQHEAGRGMSEEELWENDDYVATEQVPVQPQRVYTERAPKSAPHPEPQVSAGVSYQEMRRDTNPAPQHGGWHQPPNMVQGGQAPFVQGEGTYQSAPQGGSSQSAVPHSEPAPVRTEQVRTEPVQQRTPHPHQNGTAEPAHAQKPMHQPQPEAYQHGGAQPGQGGAMNVNEPSKADAYTQNAGAGSGYGTQMQGQPSYGDYQQQQPNFVVEEPYSYEQQKAHTGGHYEGYREHVQPQPTPQPQPQFQPQFQAQQQSAPEYSEMVYPQQNYGAPDYVAQERGAYRYPQQEAMQPPRVQPAAPVRAYEYAQIEKPRMNSYSVEPKLIASYSPKGGVGKTTLAKELGNMYSTMTVNGRPIRVLIVDMDFDSPHSDLAAHLGLTRTKPNVAAWIRDIHAEINAVGGNISDVELYTDSEIRERYVISVKENYDALLGICGEMDPNEITAQDVSLMLQSFKRSQYDVIILDCANSMTEINILPIREADNVLLISELSTAAITEVQSIIGMLKDSQFDIRKARVIFNNVPPDKEIDFNFDEIGTVLGKELFAIINSNGNVRQKNNLGTFITDDKKTQFYSAINKIAVEFFPVDVEQKKKGFMAFLERLFRKK